MVLMLSGLCHGRLCDDRPGGAKVRQGRRLSGTITRLSSIGLRYGMIPVHRLAMVMFFSSSPGLGLL